VSRTTRGSGQPPRLRVDIDKMLRFSHWLFTEDAHERIRSEDQPSDPESDGQSAA